MKWLLFMFLPTIGFAQKLPHWETSAYVYSKENSGYDLNNILGAISEKPNGKLLCQPYQKNLLEIGNSSTSELQSLNNISKSEFSAFFRWKNLDWYCCSSGFYAVKTEKIVRQFERFFKPTESVGGYHLFNDNLYFITYELGNKNEIRFKLYSCNGQRIRLLNNKSNGILIQQSNKQLFAFIRKNNWLFIYSIEKNGKPLLKNKVKFNGYLDHCLSFQSPNQFQILDHAGFIHSIKDGRVISKKTVAFNNYLRVSKNFKIENFPLFRTIQSNNRIIAQTSLGSNIGGVLYSKSSNSIYTGTETTFLRLFPHVKIYPRVYFNNNSNSTFSLTQDYRGRIWAGSYQGELSIFDNQRMLQTKKLPYKWLAQGYPLNNKMLLTTDTENGILLFNKDDSYRKIADSVSVFNIYKTRDNILYIGTALKGLWYTPVSALDKKTIKWQKVTSKNGLNQKNIIAIAEDRFGNIWTGNSGSIAVYQPKTGHCKTWLKDDKTNSHLGARSILTDTDQNIWFGSVNGGLYYYSGTNPLDLDCKNLHAIHHPLLHYGSPITFLHQWRQYLLIGAQDKVLIFDLKKWKENQKIHIQYLNSMELNLQGTTEQNTCFTDFRDSTFWFSTSQNIYRIDLKKWFQVPKFKIEPRLIISTDSTNNQSVASLLKLKAGENSFKVSVHYQSKDNMPRYLNGALTKKGESPKFTVPNLQHEFNYSNLESGSYFFHVRICQQDGSYTIHHFPIEIEAYVWQLWWFWALLSLIPILLIAYIFWKRGQLKDREKQVAQLSLATLSNQFRPHYMLNALNGISAQLEGKPKATELITHLGESIDLLFQSAKSNQFTHAFANEWKLVQHIIEIQRLLYLPDLKVIINGRENIPNDFPLPTGLLQIPVENALLHGLRHKIDGEKRLTILVEEQKDSFTISVTDNGVGRKHAEKINNFKQYGSGLSTVRKMVKIMNELKPHSFEFELFDLEEGTKVFIRFNK